jgi:hypothetical protein
MALQAGDFFSPISECFKGILAIVALKFKNRHGFILLGVAERRSFFSRKTKGVFLRIFLVRLRSGRGTPRPSRLQ